MTLELASSELEKVNSYRAPVDKAQCVVRCCSFLFNQLSVNRNDKNARPGADDFLPVFIYVVLHSSVSQLHANIDYVGLSQPTGTHVQGRVLPRQSAECARVPRERER